MHRVIDFLSPLRDRLEVLALVVNIPHQVGAIRSILRTLIEVFLREVLDAIFVFEAVFWIPLVYQV
jgi:hypothetical protein